MNVEIKKYKDLPKIYIKKMIDTRVKTWGENTRNFDKDELKSLFFFVKDNNKITAFGTLTPVRINYLSKSYNIFGIGNIIAIIKGRGYGKTLMKEMIKYLEENNKTGLGFTGDKTIGFYKKIGFKTKKNLCNRFFYDYGNEKKNNEEMKGDGLYVEGKDKFISKVINTKSMVKIPVPHW